MQDQPQKNGLTQTLRTIKNCAEGDTITFGALVETFNHKGFGPLLIVPAFLLLLPTGAVPGLPAACGVFVILVAGQILMGRSHPWLPGIIKNLSLKRERYNRTYSKILPYAKRLDMLFRPRLKILQRTAFQKIIALICIVLSCLIIVIGFIPFGPVLPGLAILMFGLGLSVQDGFVTLSGFGLAAATFAGALHLF